MLEPPVKRVVSYLSAARGRVTMGEGFLRGREHLRRQRKQKGFSMIELVIVASMIMIIGGLAIPSFMTMLRNFRIAGDASSLNGEILMAKMRAAARFTQTRINFDLATNQYRAEWWDKTPGSEQWRQESVGAPGNLSRGVTFSFGGVGTDPNGNPTALSPACMSGAAGAPGGGTPDTNSACIIFNSRGIPITPAGNPTAIHAVYITDGTAVFGVTLSATGLNRVWRTEATDASGAYWYVR